MLLGRSMGAGVLRPHTPNAPPQPVNHRQALRYVGHGLAPAVLPSLSLGLRTPSEPTNHVQAPQQCPGSQAPTPPPTPTPLPASTNSSTSCVGNFLQLGQLSTAASLVTAWQQQVLPACLAEWQQLAAAVQPGLSQQLLAAVQGGDEPTQQGVLSWVEQWLAGLDALLGTCQQVLLVCGLLKDHHADAAWRRAAAEVFVDARSLEQQACSDEQLQQGLLCCLEILASLDTRQQQRQQQQQQQQEQQRQQEREPAQDREPAQEVLKHSQQQQQQQQEQGKAQELLKHIQQQQAAPSHPDRRDTCLRQQCRELQQVAHALLKHMLLEASNPAGLTVATVSSSGNSSSSTSSSGSSSSREAQVLSPQEQQALLSGLLGEQKAIVDRMMALLLDDEAAPVVEMDKESRTILFAPLQTSSAAAAAAAAAGAEAGAAAEANSHAAATTAGTCDYEKQMHGSEATDVSEVKLTLPLVSHLLQHHPDAAVRAEVYQAGLLQRLDGLLLLWGDLAEVRRRIARKRGHSSYAAGVLQHSWLGSPAAAATFCEQFAMTLRPPADANVAVLQHQHEQQQHPVAAGRDGTQPPQQLPRSDVPYLMRQQAQQQLLSPDDLQRLQPYLQLPGVMSGLDRVLQLMLGLSLKPRAPAAGECWAPHVQVYELWEQQATQDQQAQGYSATNSINCSSSSSSTSIGSSSSGLQGSSDGDGAGRAAAQALSCTRRLLGTVYLDVSGGFSAQLLSYGSGYTFLGTEAAAAMQPLQQQQQPLSQPQPQPPSRQQSQQQVGTATALRQHKQTGGSSASAAGSGDGQHAAFTSSDRGSSKGSSRGVSDGRGSLPAVAVGLHSGGVLAGGYDQAALGLWELCHELGHAMHFILSASTYDGASRTGGMPPLHQQGTQQQQQQQQQQQEQEQEQEQQHQEQQKVREQGTQPQRPAVQHMFYHSHAAWLPVELLELPSTLFEALVMDPGCLRLICRQQGINRDPSSSSTSSSSTSINSRDSSGDSSAPGSCSSSGGRCGDAGCMPPDLAARLAAFMRHSHYQPAVHLHTVLAMLYDLEMADVSSRQLGRHAAHHTWSAIMQQLSAMPGVEVTLQQVLCIPRLLQSSSQGYGYAVAWSLAQLLAPGLVQHINLAAKMRADEGATRGRQQHWRRLLGAGSDLADPVWLAKTVVSLQEQNRMVALQTVQGRCDGGLLLALKEEQLWPLSEAEIDRWHVLATCLRCALDAAQALDNMVSHDL